MESFFREKFKNKTKEDLLQIVSNERDYQPEAVKIALEILNEETYKVSVSHSEAQDLVDQDHYKSKKSIKPFNLRPFLRSWSHRDLFSILALAPLTIALNEVVILYSNERFIEGNVETINFIVLFGILIGHHIVYKKEHKRSNNFIGRSTNDLFFIIVFIIIRSIYSILIGLGSPISQTDNFFDILVIPLAIVLIIFAFELLLSMINRFFKLFKWNLF